VAPDPAGAVTAASLLEPLDPERREAFVLTQLLGLSYAEAAEVAGVAVGTIRSRVSRARAELADLATRAEEA
jgi:RNA polymerase sigma-70 factor (ECF subfamily)